MFNRAAVIDEQLVAYLTEARARGVHDPALPVRAGASLTGNDLLELFESQATCRHLDLMAREMRARGQGFYTIASAGHEANAVVGRVTRHTDPAYLHYRSGALVAERARKLPGQNFIRDTLLGLAASSEDPAAGGRHKVWGSRELWVLPQTSTIASHLPKAVGAAMGLVRARKLGVSIGIPEDAIVVCSFGDASSHHSTAQGAFGAASYARHQRIPAPILFVCEDNSMGISVPTPADWIQATFAARPMIRYFVADGSDLVDAYEVALEAVRFVRERRQPALFHLRVVRLLGHAGTDLEAAYRSMDEIADAEARDPVLATARLAIECGVAAPERLLELYQTIRQRVADEAELAVQRPQLTSAAQVMAPLAPYTPAAVAAEASRVDHEARRAAFGDRPPGVGKARPLAAQLNRALTDLMVKYPELVVFGEDVGKKGGVYGVTAGLFNRFGPARVFNTILDEQSILGIAQGYANAGLLPLPEIQYLAYIHNALDQLRGEACSLQFFSGDQFRNPMVVRVASFGYQRGFGGHFHNDNSIAALRDIPGLVIAVPSRGDDAVAMLRSCVALAKVDGRVVAFLEPIALYHTRDLYEEGDGLWQTDYPEPDQALTIGEPRVYHPQADALAIISYANGTYLSLRAARTLEREHGVCARVVDLRWLNPLNVEAIAAHASQCGRVLVVDEGRRTGGVAEAVITAIAEGCDPMPRIARVAAHDCYIPLGPAALLMMPSEEDIVARALSLTAAG